MRIIKDTDGSEFGLGKNRNVDGYSYATKSATRKAILTALRGESDGYDLKVIRKNDRDDFYRVRVSLRSGKLSLGCHTFARKVSQVILRWAGITPTQFATAHRVGQKVRRGF